MVSKGTIMRTVFLAVTLALTDVFFLAMVVVLMRLGLITDVVAGGYATTLVGANIAAARAWWKNNSFTQKAIDADLALESLRELDKGVAEDDTDV